MDAGYRGRAAPCQRERSDRALDRVTAIDTRPLRRFPDTRRHPPFGLLAEAVPQQPRAGDRPVSGARPALWTDNRETSGCVVETDCGRPPQPARPLSRKILNRPLNLYSRPSRPSCAFPGPRPAMCHRPPGHERVFQRFVFFSTGRTNPPSAQIRGRGPELPLNRHGHVIERLLGLDAIAPSPGC